MNFLKKFFHEKLKNEYCFICNKTEHDPLTNKLFKHYRTQKIYRYLFAATSKDHNDDLVVVYQDVENNKIYTRKWNNFFGSIGPENNRTPRFEEL